MFKNTILLLLLLLFTSAHGIVSENTISMDACTQYGWEIPFPQLTVHGMKI